MNVSDRCIYEQLSEDWRNRDRLTWQLPAVLVVVALLLASLYGEPFGKAPEVVRLCLLWAGFGFAWLSTVMLAGNLYLQAVTVTLLDEIQNQGPQIADARVGARRIPKRLSQYRFLRMLKDLTSSMSSFLLLLLCALITGLFQFLVWNFREWWFVGGGVLAVASALAIVYLSWKWFPGEVQGKGTGRGIKSGK